MIFIVILLISLENRQISNFEMLVQRVIFIHFLKKILAPQEIVKIIGGLAFESILTVLNIVR